MLECKQSEKDIVGDKWTLGELKGLYIDNFWTWIKIKGFGYDGDAYLLLYKGVDFEKEIWLEFGNIMRRKHRSVFQVHLKYVCNDIVKPFRVVILHYTESVEEMHDLSKYIPPPSMKGEIFEASNWKVHGK